MDSLNCFRVVLRAGNQFPSRVFVTGAATPVRSSGIGTLADEVLELAAHRQPINTHKHIAKSE